MHRGNYFNTDLKEKTLPAADNGLSVPDGIEPDIQLSKDGTLWLDHSNEVLDYAGNIIGCFHLMTDAETGSVAE